MTEMEFRRRYREHGETVCFNLKDTDYAVDERGNFHIEGREWQSAKQIRDTLPWNNFIQLVEGAA
ncbi:hypothetical protein D3C86_1943460 [compost metagenome]